MKILCATVLFTLAGLAFARPAAAVVIYDESVQGDLSGDRFNPTHLMLEGGTNSLLATTVRNDLEYVWLTVPAGRQLDGIVLDSYAGADGTAFIGVQVGTTFTEPASGADPANLLGYTHFGSGPGNVGADILPEMGMGFGSMGFTPPLPAGDYTFWIQQLGMSPCTYRFDFNVVPEPAAMTLVLLGLTLLRRRK